MKILAILLVTISFFSVGCSHYGKRGQYHQKMFSKMDANGDGSLSKKEFESRHNEMWKGMDADKDGKVTQAEMKAHHKAKRKSECTKGKHKDDCKTEGCSGC